MEEIKKRDIRGRGKKVSINISEATFKTESGEMKKTFLPSYDKSEKWVQEYMKQFGEDLDCSFLKRQRKIV